jgi:hypothetical protein
MPRFLRWCKVDQLIFRRRLTERLACLADEVPLVAVQRQQQQRRYGGGDRKIFAGSARRNVHAIDTLNPSHPEDHEHDSRAHDHHQQQEVEQGSTEAHEAWGEDLIAVVAGGRVGGGSGCRRRVRVVSTVWIVRLHARSRAIAPCVAEVCQ